MLRAYDARIGSLSQRVCRRGVRGFSLVEVVLATGLATFALLVIFSLMPVGLHSLNASNRQIVETEIFNTVGAELASTPFFDTNSADLLIQYQQARFPIYFDNEGIEVDAPGDAVFTVRSDAPVSRLGTELKSVTVSVGYRVDPSSSPPKDTVTKRFFLLANRQGKGG